MSNGLSNLMQNKLFLQYLSGAGQDIASGQPISANVNQITQQNIAAQNYMKLLQRMLSGEVPEGGKVTMDSKGMKIDIPKGGETSDSGKQLSLGVTGATGQNEASGLGPLMLQGGLGFLNPSTSPLGDISGADLAGLTTQDISSALEGALGVEALRQKTIRDMLSAIPEQPDIFPISVPGVGQVSTEQWKALPTSEKEYAAYVHAAKQLGDEDIMTREEFKTIDPTNRAQFLRELMENPELAKMEKELREAGATRISLGEKLAEKKAISELEGQLYFKDPDWIDDLNKHLSSEAVLDKLFTLEPEDRNLAKAEETIKFIENKIKAGGGTIQDVKWAEDGTTMIWTVKWPSGDVETIRYGVRD